jgi:hypothetical protein
MYAQRTMIGGLARARGSNLYQSESGRSSVDDDAEESYAQSRAREAQLREATRLRHEIRQVVLEISRVVAQAIVERNRERDSGRGSGGTNNNSR